MKKHKNRLQRKPKAVSFTWQLLKIIVSSKDGLKYRLNNVAIALTFKFHITSLFRYKYITLLKDHYFK